VSRGGGAAVNDHGKGPRWRPSVCF
jgi:hypothetical protein